MTVCWYWLTEVDAASLVRSSRAAVASKMTLFAAVVGAPADIVIPRIAWANVPNACATFVSCAVTQVSEPLQAVVFDWNDVSAVLSVAYEPSTLIASAALLTCVSPGVLVDLLVTPWTI